jgi:secreted trypsin-like serine protease
MSSLGEYEVGKWVHHCGATLVTHKHFLTAAHCIKNNTDQKIHVGDFNLSLLKPQQLGIDVNTKEVNIHPLYNYKNAYFDIAIITTDHINFTVNIQPICLPEYSSTDVHKYDRDQVDLLGWGASSYNGIVTDTLRRVSQTVFPKKYCNETHIRYDKEKKNIQKAVPDLFPSHLICAGTDVTSQGACTGDSGGPLQFFDFDSKRYQQLGVVHGSVSNCGQSAFPGIYVRLDDPTIFNFLKSATQVARIDSR